MLLFFVHNMGAAQSLQISRSHAINMADQPLTQLQPGDTITVIAVRVEFQEDDNRFTSGNGTFSENSIPYLSNHDITIDPLPHDRSYFEAHLTFAKNYFAKVSGGNLNIEFRVLPFIIQLDEPMQFYSPTGTDFTNRKLAFMARDAWEKVDETGNFSTDSLNPEHTAFAIFHAGVGRDIELVGTTLDKTPQDIPSIFLSKQSLSDLLDKPTFEGFPINNGSFKITNTMILPRTLSRRGEDAAGNEFVLQLSINGLLSASIGSFLGLPDLFNTQTGASGIGRFGLMDGESFFSYRGLFPPEPSAWEKKFLGWNNTFPIILDKSRINLPAVSTHQVNSIGRYSISSEEYFLVENRHRDPQADGSSLTIQKSDGSTVMQAFTNSDHDFVNQTENFTDLLEPGVLIEVDNYDWSLPGGMDIGPDGTANTTDDRELNGGILIWHIDEAVIKDKIDLQQVNADSDRRGVDLEEADGVQDIGRAAASLFREEARGTAFDFWWKGNSASVITPQNDTLSFYENRFAGNTKPSNDSNSGAPSFFEFYDFSANLPVASFRARPTSSRIIEPISLPLEQIQGLETSIGRNSYLNNYPTGLSIYTAQTDTFLVIPSKNTLHALQLNTSSPNLFDFQLGSAQQPYLGSTLVLSENPGGKTNINTSSWQWSGSNWAKNWETMVPANKGFISSVDDNTLFIDFTRSRLDVNSGNSLADLPVSQQRSISLSGSFSVLQAGEFSISNTDINSAINTDRPRIYTGALELSDNKDGYYIITDQSFTVIDPLLNRFSRTIVKNTPFSWPAMVDFNRDGRIDILYVDKRNNTLTGRNHLGAVLDFFPISAPEGSSFSGTPLVADMEGDGNLDIAIPVQDSLSLNIFVYNNKGNLKEGFPLFVGSIEDSNSLAVHPVIHGNTLFAVSHIGELKAWKFPEISNVTWSSLYGNEPFNKVTGRLQGNNSPAPLQSVLVSKETYNWPNPASDHTNIRFQIQQAGTVDIKIIKPSGKVVYQQSINAIGGAPEEHTISTRQWSSGLYFGLITASVGDKKEHKLIKIAVAH